MLPLYYLMDPHHHQSFFRSLPRGQRRHTSPRTLLFRGAHGTSTASQRCVKIVGATKYASDLVDFDTRTNEVNGLVG